MAAYYHDNAAPAPATTATTAATTAAAVTATIRTTAAVKQNYELSMGLLCPDRGTLTSVGNRGL